MSRQSVAITVISLIVWLAVTIWLVFRSGGSYLPAWFVFQSAILFLLLWMIMPKKIVVSDDRIFVSCYLRLITIPKSNVVESAVIRHGSRIIPLSSTMGFLGYCGYYYYPNLKKIARMIARSKENLVYIKLKSGKILILSISDYEQFSKILGNIVY